VTKKLPVHPATYSKEIVPVMHELLYRFKLPGLGTLLDPMAGLGRDLTPTGIEIEQIYFDLGLTDDCVIQGDSTDMHWVAAATIAAACVSVPYPNGVSDNFRSKEEDVSVRHTYIHRIRQYAPDYELHPNNSGGMNPRRSPKAYRAFMDLHDRVYAEVSRVLRPGAPFIWNGKDTLKYDFVDDTVARLRVLGFHIKHVERVLTPGLNHGENSEQKVSGEFIVVAIKPAR
jgi:hypothetical protein